MGLLEQLEAEDERRTEPFERALDDRIRYLLEQQPTPRGRPVGLTGEEMEMMTEDVINHGAAAGERVERDMPLFYRSSPATYKDARETIAFTDTRYLAYARSPSDISLATTLHEMNADLDEDRLEQYTFRTLVAYEQAKEELQEFRDELRELEDKREKRYEGPIGRVFHTVDRIGRAKYDSDIADLEQTISRYEDFVQDVEGDDDD